MRPVQTPSPPRDSAASPAFRLIVFSPPRNVTGEQDILSRLFEAGLERLHLRKPGMPERELGRYLDAFREWRSRIVLHGVSLRLAEQEGLCIHMPFSRLRELTQAGEASALPAPTGKPSLRELAAAQKLSSSVHSWQEYAMLPPRLAYVFVSPLFDSISKKGYRSRPALWELPEDRSIAAIGLGGIHAGNVAKVREAGFSGAALLGAIWEEPAEALRRFRQIRCVLDNGRESEVKS